MSQIQRKHCDHCGRVIPKPRPGFSTIEYRRIVGGLTSHEDLEEHKDKLIAIVKKASRVPDYAKVFTQILGEISSSRQGDQGELLPVPLENIKRWLYEQINNLPCTYGEKKLYEFLHAEYCSQNVGIDETFTIFYDKFLCFQNREDCGQTSGLVMNKNLVSRALKAIGIKTKMVRRPYTDVIMVGQYSRFIERFKSTMVIRVAADELRSILDSICLTQTLSDT